MNLTKADNIEIKRKKADLERQMDGEIDSLLNTRQTARIRLDDDLQPVHTLGQGRRTGNCRANYRRQMVWGRPVKMRFGALG